MLFPKQSLYSHLYSTGASFEAFDETCPINGRKYRHLHYLPNCAHLYCRARGKNLPFGGHWFCLSTLGTLAVMREGQWTLNHGIDERVIREFKEIAWGHARHSGSFLPVFATLKNLPRMHSGQIFRVESDDPSEAGMWYIVGYSFKSTLFDKNRPEKGSFRIRRVYPGYSDRELQPWSGGWVAPGHVEPRKLSDEEQVFFDRLEAFGLKFVHL
jgi:hypothetical protein